jgi:hypothetical protein
MVYNCAHDPGCIEAAKLAMELPEGGGGGGGGGVLATVTITLALVALLPAASLATALSVCEPLLAVVVFHDAEYGDEVSRLPRLAPSTRNCTLATATLSEAFAVIVMVPVTPDPFTGEEMDIVGGVVSGVPLWTVTVTEPLVAKFPAPSLAMARRVCDPLADFVVSHEYE